MLSRWWTQAAEWCSDTKKALNRDWEDFWRLHSYICDTKQSSWPLLHAVRVSWGAKQVETNDGVIRLYHRGKPYQILSRRTAPLIWTNIRTTDFGESVLFEADSKTPALAHLLGPKGDFFGIPYTPAELGYPRGLTFDGLQGQFSFDGNQPITFSV
jgi:hypothetical protein